MSPFEELYGWSCNTPISWSDPSSKVLIRPNMLADMEHEMQMIKNNLKVAQDRQKSYAYKSWLFEFQVGNNCTCTSNRRRAPCRLDHVPSWHLSFVDLSISLKGLDQ